VKRIPTLDGWRAIAVLAVIVHHVSKFYCGSEYWWIWRGAVGVDVFFAVSGLLITSQLLQNGNLKSFYIRRVFRILPPAIVYLTIVLALHLIDSQDFLRCLAIQRNYTNGSVYSAHFWSLSLEEQFYLVWPPVLLLSGKRAPMVAMAGILAVCLWRPYALLHLGMGYVRTDLRCDGLLWGCVTAFALRTANVKFGRILPAVCFIAAVLVWGIPIFMPILPILVSITVLGTVQEPHWIMSRLLEWKPLVWIGQRSYGIYLWQSFFIMVPINVPMILKVGAAIVWSAVLYRFFETPLRQVGRRLALR
jgi:peptidoglycan/LPS O-acetylase OafA/YrhL